ncbi:MAG: 4-(cytidine 5'-diphospho)-2-C-methyl-D-erythritol kinase [Cognatishimia sp.]|uniref:4-(cytidine 5'-diphospho)-2-C-methyl-D-erythritol kinase n=1 Tax=Cognatishimia sp. TaxID=2211648 RepID=UPI004058A2F2
MTANSPGFAPAKINLTLHVTGQRADGYHLLDSIVAFADIGDEVSANPSDRLSLTVTGSNATGVPTDGRNLMIKAARLLDENRTAALHLNKQLPPASGIGGGSSDAAATIRVLSALWDLPIPTSDQVLTLGADLPVCLTPCCQRMRGIGDNLSALPDLPACDVLLVNPGVHVATPAIFKALTSRDNAPMATSIPRFSTATALADWLNAQRNDLEPPARALAPEIAEVLAALRSTDPLIARMSGSGATCFALYPHGSPNAQMAAQNIASAHPNWWLRHGQLLP